MLIARASAAVALLAILLAPAVGVRADDSPTRCRALSVFVFVEGESAPREGARVVADGTGATLTDARGMAHLSCVAPAATLLIEAAGLAPATTPPINLLGDEADLIITLRKDGSPPDLDSDFLSDPRPALPLDASTDSATPATAITARGILRGTVTSTETGEPIADASVVVRGVAAEAKTNATGNFDLELPATRVTLTVFHARHTAQTLENVEIVADETRTITVTLTPASLSLADYVVTAPYIEGSVASTFDEERDSVAVAEVIGAEQMARSGDGDAAAALRRVTGLSLVGGKYVYVRGMGERYSSTLVNRAQVPSPEPERRVVPLDLFPTSVLKSVTIQKTYSPDLPGEFGGGTIMIETRGSPEGFVAQVDASTGGNTETTFQNGITSDGGALDSLGFDDGTRALPEEVRTASENQKLLPGDRFSEDGYTPEQLQALGRAMPNIWATREMLVLPDLSLNGTVGSDFKLGLRPAGALFSAGWSQDWQAQHATRRYLLVGSGDQLEIGNEYQFNQLNRDVTLNGIFDFKVSPHDGHELAATSLVNRKTEDETRNFTGINRNVQQQIDVTRLKWLEQTLFSQQIRGTHEIAEAARLKLDWRYAFSLAARYEPDLREYRYDYNPVADKFLLNNLLPDGNWRRYSDVGDRTHDTALDATIPFHQWGGLEGRVKFGPALTLRNRNANLRIYKFQAVGASAQAAELLAKPIEEIFAPENINSDAFQIEEITRETDNYTASQSIYAGYAMTELPLHKSLILVTGLRVERSIQEVQTFELFNPDNVPVVATLDNTDLLPAGTLTWSLREDMLLRAAVSRTLSRPDFRELSPAVFNDVVGGRAVRGNENLRRASIINADLRWEWYPTSRETLAAAVFFKAFDEPVEMVVVPSNQPVSTFANAKGAFNTGIEIEFRKHFDFITPVLDGMYVAGNLSWIYSRIELDPASGVQTSSDRALQGQSPYIVNLQLGYDNPDTETSVALLYNVQGPFIAEVGANRAPDIFAEPVHQLDFTLSQALGAGFALKFKARNLLDWPVERTQGDFVQETYRRGRAFTLGVSWSY